MLIELAVKSIYVVVHRPIYASSIHLIFHLLCWHAPAATSKTSARVAKAGVQSGRRKGSRHRSPLHHLPSKYATRKLAERPKSYYNPDEVCLHALLNKQVQLGPVSLSGGRKREFSDVFGRTDIMQANGSMHRLLLRRGQTAIAYGATAHGTIRLGWPLRVRLRPRRPRP